MLVDGPVDVAPLARDLHVGLVDEPTVSHPVTARPGRVCEEWCETLSPPIHSDVIDLDPTLTVQLLDIAVRESVPQIPPHGKDDDLRREPKPDKRRRLDHGYRTGTTKPHHTTLTSDRAGAPMQLDLTRFAGHLG